MQLRNVLYEKRAGVAYVTVNRPKVLNALDHQTLAELREAFEDVRADAEAIYSYEGTREMNTLIVGRAVSGLSAFV